MKVKSDNNLAQHNMTDEVNVYTCYTVKTHTHTCEMLKHNNYNSDISA